MNFSFRNIRKIIFLLLLFVPLSVAAQSKAEKTQKKADKKKAKQEQKAQVSVKKAEKRHARIQTKETRKRMKKHKKVANRVNDNKSRETFFQRLFKKKSR
jgi:LAS superfamily LD-carboxypeptidase LdcB